MSFEGPRIKLEVEHMKHTMISAFARYQDDLNEMVKEGLEKAINNFDFPKAVAQITADIIQEAIKNYFAYGDGRQLIDNAVTTTLNQVLKPKP